jgi:MSHA biogenesis protein MshO
MGSQRGFTLIELIMVIVILGIISTISVRFIQFSTQGAIDTADRQKMALGGSIMTEQISREVRDGLPTSLRIHDDGNRECLEFIRIAEGGRYTEGDRTEPADEFETEDGAQTDEPIGRVSIYPYAGDVYASGTEVLSITEGDWSGNTVEFGGSETFATNSPRRRFHVLGSPVTYCERDGFLLRYSGYGVGNDFENAEPAVAGAGLSGATFGVDAPSLTRNALVTIELQFEADRTNETHTLAQEVQIRNVP